jgi:hypothetical protein
MASFETGLYDENLIPRTDFALADVFGIHQAGAVIGTVGNAYYGRIDRQQGIIEGFNNTNWLPGAQNRVPLKPVQNPVLTVVPGFVRYPPELAYPPISQTDEPAVVLREVGSSRVAYFSGDIERSYWLTGHGDLLRLLHNTIRWITGNEQIVQVEGEGFIEMIAWETTVGYAVHVLNYTNPNAHHAWMQSVYPLGPQTVRMKLPPSARVRSVELLRGGQSLRFNVESEVLQFTIPHVDDYEVAAVTVA